MEILVVVLLVALVAALAFAWMSSRRGGRGGVMPGRHGGVRGRRRAAVAARDDPMATAVERHSAATDPHEAAEEELRLRAQANRVASELHAREASALESQAGRAAPADGYARPLTDGGAPAYDDRRDGDPAYLDEHGRPVYEDDRPRY